VGRRRRRPLPEPAEAAVESLSHDGRGVIHLDGKTVFVHGALPGEHVRFAYTRVQRRYDEGVIEEVLEASTDRVPPRCPHFGVCGGCSLQHLAPDAQVAAKQRALLDALAHIGGVEPADVLPPLVGDSRWGYRRKARLGVKYVPAKGRALVGFRERGSSFVTDLTRCEVLHPRVGLIIEDLGALVDGLSIRDRVPQIEVSMGDESCVLVLRVLTEPSGPDLEAMSAFATRHGVHVCLQGGGPESLRFLKGQGVDLTYRLPAHQLTIGFEPLDFTQVNLEVNRRMVDRALDLLAPEPDERVLDLFCGLGNFTLPLARRAGEVVGVEGDAGLVERARANARRNALSNVEFLVADLYGALEHVPWLERTFDKILLDPPRSGAAEILPRLRGRQPRRLVYVSCHPGTLARDAAILVSGLGFRLVSAGVMDMFPHTGHVESIALFERG
jgi:23S rRNA (uracil1939-C5)-methyltransferase